MNRASFHELRQFASTPFGEIAYVERGEGAVAIFLHGVPLNGFHWRSVVERLSDMRRCRALDLMGLGHTRIAADQDVAFTEQAQMLGSFLDALGIDRVDLVGNDSGGAIAQIFAARSPERLRSLTLTNCDVHDNWPPDALAPILDSARAGTLPDALSAMCGNLDLARSPAGLGQAYENPDHLTTEIVRTYLEPLLVSPETRANVCRYFLSEDCKQTVEIEPSLQALTTPTLVLWGEDDIFFPTKWAHWLERTIPGIERVRTVPGARLFFAEERPELMEQELRAFWAAKAPA